MDRFLEFTKKSVQKASAATLRAKSMVLQAIDSIDVDLEESNHHGNENNNNNNASDVSSSDLAVQQSPLPYSNGVEEKFVCPLCPDWRGIATEVMPHVAQLHSFCLDFARENGTLSDPVR